MEQQQKEIATILEQLWMSESGGNDISFKRLFHVVSTSWLLAVLWCVCLCVTYVLPNIHANRTIVWKSVGSNCFFFKMGKKVNCYLGTFIWVNGSELLQSQSQHLCGVIISCNFMTIKRFHRTITHFLFFIVVFHWFILLKTQLERNTTCEVGSSFFLVLKGRNLFTVI